MVGGRERKGGGELATDERGRAAPPEGGVGEDSPQGTGGGCRAPPNLAGDREGGDSLPGWPLDGEAVGKNKI